MNDFLKYIAKFSIILYILGIICLFLVAGALIFMPELLFKALYYSLIGVCLVTGAYMVFSLIRILYKMR